MNKQKLFILCILVLAGAACYAGWKYMSRPSVIIPAAGSGANLSAADAALLGLSKVMILPPDPHPELATVADKQKLAGQAYFENVENGDAVIVFPSIAEAVIFRPSAQKIVGFVPLAPAEKK